MKKDSYIYTILSTFKYGFIIAMFITIGIQHEWFFAHVDFLILCILWLVSSCILIWLKFSLKALEYTMEHMHYFIDAYLDILLSNDYIHKAFDKLNTFLPDPEHMTKEEIIRFLQSKNIYDYFKKCITDDKVKEFNKYMKAISKNEVKHLIDIDDTSKDANFLVKHYLFDAMINMCKDGNRLLAEMYTELLKDNSLK